MKTDTGERIVKFIKTQGRVRPHDLVREFKISSIAIHKQLRKLLGKGIISRIGTPPLVFYVIGTDYHPDVSAIDNKAKANINKSYFYVSSSGRIIEGLNGFIEWVKETKQENQLLPLISEYVKYRESANKHISNFGWIDATRKITDTFSKVYVNKLLYQDFFALPKFGKTRLGQMVLYAKTSQNRELMRDVVRLIKPVISKIIMHYQIDAVSFIPPTIPRNLQFLKETEFELNIKLPQVGLNKVFAGPVRIAQKSLPKLEQRIKNAQNTIFPAKINTSYKNILLIDDAVGSGATFNETSKKLKEEKIATGKINAFAIVGSMKGFDVISEI